MCACVEVSIEVWGEGCAGGMGGGRVGSTPTISMSTREHREGPSPDT